MDVIAINRDRRLMLLDTDELVPMETMLDADGDETDDPSEALAAVGQVSSGQWISVDLSCFEGEGREH